MLFNCKTPNKLVYKAQQNRFLKQTLKSQSGFADSSFSNYNEKPICLWEKFETFHYWKIGADRIYNVPLEFDVSKTPILGSVLDLDYHRLILDPNSSNRIQFVKRSVYLKHCYHQYPIVDEDLHTATMETPCGLETFNKVYLFPSKWDPRYEAPVRLAPLTDFKGRRYCIRNSYKQHALLIEPVHYISFDDISEDLFYDPNLDRLCDADHEDFYREHYPECFSDSENTEANQDDDWVYY